MVCYYTSDKSYPELAKKHIPFCIGTQRSIGLIYCNNKKCCLYKSCGFTKTHNVIWQ